LSFLTLVSGCLVLSPTQRTDSITSPRIDKLIVSLSNYFIKPCIKIFVQKINLANPWETMLGNANGDQVSEWSTRH